MSVGLIAPPSGGLGAASSSAFASGQTAPGALPASVTAGPATPTLTAEDAALNSLVMDAISAQDSLAPLLADLTAALQSNALPAAALPTAQRILSSQPPLDVNATGQDVRAALAGSGLFLESVLAAAVLAPGAAAPADVSDDLKALLYQLVETLSPEALTAAQEMAVVETAPAPEPARRAQGLTRGSSARPPPPTSGAPTSAQPAALASLEPEADQASLSRALRQDAQAALARLQLSQIASLPKPGAPTRWSFEWPVAAPQGHAMAQFEISRDDQGPGAAAGGASTWRAKFSINVEPNGPVHAEVTLSGGRTRVTLWSEREDARQALAAQQGDLVAELSGPEGADAAVRVLGGAPTPPAIAAGRLFNRTS